MNLPVFDILRPKQWYKNLLIFIPIVGSLNISDANSIFLSLMGFGILCMSSSGTYILNDLIDSKKESGTNDIQKYKNIGITSGASAPEELVFDLIKEIKKNSEVEVKEIEVAKENVSFKLPKTLN